MSSKHVVRFEPVGIEIEVEEEKTVLRAAAEQGLMLMHGCKEGQCSACKSFVLDGEDIELDKYSTFALPDFEKDEGYTLLCRAHVYEDVTIELLNYDEDMIRSGFPIQDLAAEVVALEPVTGDMRHLVLRPLGDVPLAFFAGQYVDIGVPGSEETRSFSMANTPTQGKDGLEFVIKIYPGGLFSGHLDGGIQVGDQLQISGPFGTFTLRDGRSSDIVLVGGGAGMAPILSLLRTLGESGSARSTRFYYGARRRQDLCFEKELLQLEQDLPDFRYLPALSEPDEEPWDGEVGMVTDVLKKHEADLSESDCYVCGPPPMVEAAMPVLEGLGAPIKRIYYDKFTTTEGS
ncbi:MAG: 2Fe-2S iron-sulfur cluster binding domain-containing protein [Nocardioidaceae bacterium]